MLMDKLKLHQDKESGFAVSGTKGSLCPEISGRNSVSQNILGTYHSCVFTRECPSHHMETFSLNYVNSCAKETKGTQTLVKSAGFSPFKAHSDSRLTSVLDSCSTQEMSFN